MAHALEHPKVQDHIHDLRNKYFAAFADSERIQNDKNGPDEKILKDVVVATLGFLNGFEKEVGRYRWWLNILDRFVNPHRHRKGKATAAGQAEPPDMESL